ncbi:DegV family protein [Clostridium botulinum]|uniref:DegV protein n=1 Tax=Clostridium botulinum D str. 1873 TaxID=592027 RepID=A0A9P2G642_CLOBO|nr:MULTISPECIES: DegV family protein [Clostridium]EES90599.1 DegV protein [Clostridium botulinum D str. 1873]MBO3442832.1 DegV family protein [Clostridium haemolyticum]NFV48405.1 DegV family protein [Clostridium botulinum]QPW56243.1 DegV family protein [Clostridium botulinum]
MNKYKILTDSCCDLPIDYLINNNVNYVSLTYRLDDKEYYDDFGESVKYTQFYDYMRKGNIPKTSQVNPQSFYNAFKEILDRNEDILYICVSSGLSGTYNSANIAKNMILDEYKDSKIEIIDVLTASLGQGLMVMKAVEMKNQGMNLEQVAENLENIRYKLNTYITVDDLNHLKRGGRISSTAALFGAVLHIKPILTLNDEGKVISILKVKGKKSLIRKLTEIVCEKIINSEQEEICICHADSKIEAEKLKESILKKIQVKNVIINDIGPVVGTYGGPGALAVFFIGQHRQNHVIDI